MCTNVKLNQTPLKSIENSQFAQPIGENRVEYDLPFGWKKIGCRRMVSATGRTWDFYLHSPSGTIQQLWNFIEYS